MSYAEVLLRAERLSPDLRVARLKENVARAEIGIAGVLPNPSLTAGTSTQAARISAGVSVPLLIFGQRGAAIEASRADLTTTETDTRVASIDVRAAAAHAYVALWRAQSMAVENQHGAALARHLEEAVAGRVELGAAPSVDGLRAHAERLRADAQAQQTEQLVAAAGSDLGRWLGMDDGADLRAKDAPPVPAPPPPIAELRARIDRSPVVGRERADAAAAEARARRERALVRPLVTLDLGLDAFDQTLCPNGPCSNPPLNYRGALTLEVPLLSMRGPYVERELANADQARARESAGRLRLAAALTSAYRTFEAWSANARALAEGVVPAATAAASAAEESYALGRAPLVAVLDAEKARIDASLALLDARSQEADAWIEVEHSVAAP
jgi:cobalt-zinc-cadmium efflux system outer membrane protein